MQSKLKLSNFTPSERGNALALKIEIQKKCFLKNLHLLYILQNNIS